MTVITEKKLEAYKELIKLNPDDYKDQIKLLKEKFPEKLGDINPYDISTLSEKEKDRAFF